MGAADFLTGLDLLHAVQLDTSEAASGTTGSYGTEFQGYINRAYWEILGKERWPWALSPTPGTIVSDAAVRVTASSISGTTVTLTATITPSMAGRKIYNDSNNAVYRITAHTSGTDTMTLDATYVETETSGALTIYQDEYLVDSTVLKIWDPMQVRGQSGQIVTGLNKPTFEAQYGKGWSVGPAPVEAFTEVHWDYTGGTGTRRIRFGPWSEDRFVVEYDYAQFHTLTYDAVASTDTPRVPREYRQVIVDLAKFYAFLLKDDSKTDSAFLNSNRMYQLMVDQYLPEQRGQLYTRPGNSVTLGLH